MKLKFILILGLLLFIYSRSSTTDFSNLDEPLVTDEEAEQLTEKLEDLKKLKKDKLDINRASYKELLILPWLSPISAKKIIDFRKTNKISNSETLVKAGLAPEVVNRIVPYLDFNQISHPLNFQYRLRSQYNSTDEYINSLPLYQRFSIEWKNFTLNFLNQKDSGENSYFDYYSGSLEIRNWQNLKKLVLGNYRLALGQGIIFNPKLGLCKGYNTTRQPIKSTSSVRSYTSASENYSLFGAATQIGLPPFTIIPFYSNYNLDATIENSKITSIYDLGYHRTKSEKQKKDRLNEIMYGVHLTYGEDNQISFNAVHLEFDHPFDDPKQRQKNNIIGLEYRYFFKNFYIFGENGFSANKFAHITGIFFEINKFKNLLLYRQYDHYFPTYHGNPFHAGGEFDNEHGIYYGIDFNIFKNLAVNIYFDIYKFPGGTYYSSIPSYGNDKLIALMQEWKNTTLRFTYKNYLKEYWENVDGTSKMFQIKKTRFRLDLQHLLNQLLQLKFRIEYSYNDYVSVDKFAKGILIYEEIRFAFSENLKNYLRIAQYHSGDLLLYMYENDIDGIMHNAQFKGDGIAGYFLLKYDLWQHYSLQFKYSQEFWKRGTAYNTGFDKQLGKAYTLKAQLEIEF